MLLKTKSSFPSDQSSIFDWLKYKIISANTEAFEPSPD
jgi:hypothetical protein